MDTAFTSLPGPFEPCIFYAGQDVFSLKQDNPEKALVAAPQQPQDNGAVILPSFPDSCDDIPSQRAGKVRILAAAAGYSRVNVSVGVRTAAASLGFGELTAYQPVMDGFHQVTVTSTSRPRMILTRVTLPFRAGESVTLALINAPTGMEILRIGDDLCQSKPRGLSCLRLVNLSYDSGAFDLALSDDRLVFTNVRFKEATPYKRIRPGKYTFLLTDAANQPAPLGEDVETVETMPIPYSSNDILDCTPSLLTFALNIEPGYHYTIFAIGLIDGSPSLQILAARDA